MPSPRLESPGPTAQQSASLSTNFKTEISVTGPVAEWCGSISRFRIIGPGLYPLAGQDRLGLSSFQWVDKWVPSLLGD
ncbi:hypothetical protein TNCV_4963011 [Trichonephila clavipes]|nr:hypothetical protein TNCV_4963011 [Trichonephila clavipes]